MTEFSPFEREWRTMIMGGAVGPLCRQHFRQIMHPGLFEFDMRHSRPFYTFDMLNNLAAHCEARRKIYAAHERAAFFACQRAANYPFRRPHR